MYKFNMKKFGSIIFYIYSWLILYKWISRSRLWQI